MNKIFDQFAIKQLLAREKERLYRERVNFLELAEAADKGERELTDENLI